jgi:hypothetical protein
VRDIAMPGAIKVLKTPSVKSLLLVTSILIGGTSISATGKEVTPDYSGKWSGSGYSNILKKSGSASGTIKQSGKKLSGHFTIHIERTNKKYADCPTTSKFIGKAKQSQFSGSLFGTNAFEARLSGNIDNSAIKGKYKITGGKCAGDHGTFTMKK